MSHTAIRVETLGKQYRIGAKLARPSTIREHVVQLLSAPFLKSDRPGDEGGNGVGDAMIWALKDVTFEIAQGEVVGVIGRNGAGKSTLLKVLSRITEPTEGLARIHGRVGSLLEVGTGFHSELTGRENIYLNGAILGMTKRGIDRKFDEIVAFAEIERFLDTPVKHYSSGMYMRLAFSVASQLETDVLLVDEVLAVGDAGFRKKCLGRMDAIGHEGRTVVFVSHSMTAITRLCPRVILLDRGRVAADGPSGEVTAAYLRSDLGTMANRIWQDPATAPGDHVVRLRRVSVVDGDGGCRATIDIRRPVVLEIAYDVLQSSHVAIPNFHLYNEEGICAFVTADTDPQWRRRPKSVGRYISRVTIPGNFLSEGTVVVDAAISTIDPVTVHVHAREAVAFQVVDSLDGDSLRGNYGGAIPGVVRPHLQWQTVVEDAPVHPTEGNA